MTHCVLFESFLSCISTFKDIDIVYLSQLIYSHRSAVHKYIGLQ